MKPKLLILYLSDKAHGWGHKVRCNVLYNTARNLGYQVRLLSNEIGLPGVGYGYYWGGLEDYKNAEAAFLVWQPDWLIVDLEDIVPNWLPILAQQYRCRICNINANGWAEKHGINVEQPWADMVWVQDTPERMIIRRSVLEQKREPGSQWFVFGGAADPLKVLPLFDQALPTTPAWLVQTNLASHFNTHNGHELVITSGDAVLPFMANAKAACVHFGIISWELAAMGVPTYALSRSDAHLYYAKRVEEFGLGRAFPRVGLPDEAELRTFLAEPCAMTGQKPDGRGAERLLAKLDLES